MFTRGDFDLNLVLRYDPLPKEVLKQAMLKQEHIFKKQILMKDLDWEEVDGMDTIIRSHLCPSLNGARPVLLPADKSFCTFPVGLQERRVFFEQRLLVPQFCSDQHFNHINRDNLVKENSFLCPQKPIKIPSEEVDLSLSIGWNKQRKEACKKTWDHIIDLEDSNETFGYVGYSGGNYDSSSTRSITHGPDKNPFEGTDRSHSTVDCSRGLFEQSSSSKGVTQCCNVVISEERALLDLNRHPNELSFQPTDLGSVSSSPEAFLRDSNGMVGESHDNDISHDASNGRDQADDDRNNEPPKSPRHEDAESSGNNDSNLQAGKGKAAEVDKEVQKGAVSLLFFKLECTRDRSSKARQKENDSNEQQPQHSSDTFESMVLKQPECNVDDSCVSSKPFEVNDTNSKDCGITLRRGRRMKDFRRDILPNLASLSRPEISEDIKIMETVLRSREYKKIMSRMKGDQQKCFTPVRSKRSRLNYAGQKHHS